MKRLKRGNIVWVARYNRNGFERDKESLERVRADIFRKPEKYIIVDMIESTNNRDKCVLRLASAETKESVENDGEVNTAALPGSERGEETELNLEIDLRETMRMIRADDYYISRKKSKINEILMETVTKHYKECKRELKYSYSNLILSCLYEIKSESQMIKLMKIHPENFI